MAARLEIDLGALQDNYRRLAHAAAPAVCGATVKADAYGLGAQRVVPALLECGCTELFVATADEALALLESAAGATIHVFEGALPGRCAALAEAGIVPVLNHPGQVASWSREARRRGQVLPAALHVDTGMTRLGMSPDEARATLRGVGPGTGVDVRLLLTHLACADLPEHPLNARQVETFAALCAEFPGIRTSIGNSAGTLGAESLRGHLVRPGIALYGGNPFSDGRDNPMACVARLVAPVLQVRELHAAAPVGYGASEWMAHGSRLATIGIGYADGYPRSLSGVGQVVWNGRRLRLVGRVSMVLVVIELGDADLAPGDEVELFGPALPLDTVADWAGTIGYELLTSISPRVQRAVRAVRAA